MNIYVSSIGILLSKRLTFFFECNVRISLGIEFYSSRTMYDKCEEVRHKTGTQPVITSSLKKRERSFLGHCIR